ncbi:MAG: T9SS type A sorting domain-containing protein [Candidatus Marinimicrobia bacterium]|nr:T9SS type A sorting domain-containing protein [Candidatus Neomarinimicrobiota bacterium]
MKKLLLVVFLIHVIVFAQNNVFILCEGNMTQSNASLWMLNEDLNQITGPIHWDPNANPLGDVGQSMTIYNNKLFIIMNNSNTVEIMDLSNEVSYESTISLPYAGPREMEVVNGKGYLSCWHLNAILVIDLSTNTFLDTISVNGLPEDLIYYDNRLYTSINMNPDWSSGNRILSFDISGDKAVVIDTFEVISGPGQILSHDGNLFVVSTYYDTLWNIYSGTSRIDLSDGSVTKKDYGVTFNFGIDITLYHGLVYRTYNGGIAPLTDSLTVDITGQIGDLPNVYSMATYKDYIYFGLSDYMAPDDVVILDSLGNLIGQFQVGAIPGSFAFYEVSQTNLTEGDNDLQIATGYSLHQNFPNPFNSSTTIPYYIGEKGHVTISIYNLLGKHIVDLVNMNQNNGNKSISWNGINQFGDAVPGGIYFYQLEISNKVVTKKMIYLR